MNKVLPKTFYLSLLVLLMRPGLGAQTIIPNNYRVEHRCNYDAQTLQYVFADGSETWTAANSPYIIEGSVFVEAGLTIEAGTILKFKTNAYLRVQDAGINVNCDPDGRTDGVLNAQGTSANPIVFTSFQDDSVGGDSNGDGNASVPEVGDWISITVASNAEASFQHCQFYYAGDYRSVSNLQGNALQIFGTATVDHCHFEQISGPVSIQGHHVGLGKSINAAASFSNLSFGPEMYEGISLLSNNVPGTYTLAAIQNYPYIISGGEWRIYEDQTINVQPGTIFKLEDQYIDVDGTLNAVGTSAEPIVFTSTKDDSKGGDTNGDGNASSPDLGDWVSISVTTGAEATFQHCEFYYAGDYRSTSNFQGNALQVFGTATINNCYFDQIGGRVSIQGHHIGIGKSINAAASFSNLSFGPEMYEGISLLSNNVPGTYTLAAIQNYPYIISGGEWRIYEDQTINVQPGTIFKLEDQYIDVDGTLNAAGTSSEPIVFTSTKDDNFAGDTNRDGKNSKAKTADWEYISIAREGNATFAYCQFQYGGVGQQTNINAPALLIRNNVSVANCKFFENTIPLGISLDAAPNISQVTFRNNIYNGIGILGGTYSDIAGNFTLPQYPDQPYLIYRNTIIPEQMSLTLPAGTVIKFFDKSEGLIVNGSLQAAGTAEHKIVFTSARHDLGGDTNGDGNASKPGIGDWGYLTINGSANNTAFRHCEFSYGGIAYFNRGALRAEGPCTVDQCSFTYNEIGLSLGNDEVVVDSCTFTDNEVGIVNHTENASLQHSYFKNNSLFDAENKVATDLQAPRNQWNAAEITETLDYLQGTITNLSTVRDQQDNGALGRIQVAPVDIPVGINSVTPEVLPLSTGTAALSIRGYRFAAGASVLFCKAGAPDLLPVTYQILDTLTATASFDFSGIEPGLYDVCVVNPTGDTLRLVNGFALLDNDGLPFGEWIPFSVANGDVYAGGVNIPNTADLFVLVKKADRIGYASTWKGTLKLYRATAELDEEDSFEFLHSGSRLDMDLHLKNPKSGYHTFEIETSREQGSGEILFTDQLPALSAGEWTRGEVLRPYGYDWKEIEVASNTDTLFLRTDGFGLWSTMEVYYEQINNNAPYWEFKNWGAGYAIDGFIPDPPAGTYYVRYLDSAVLKDSDGYAEEQQREYLIIQNTSKATTAGTAGLTITGTSMDSLGTGIVTFDIYGTGFAASDAIRLVRGSEVIQPEGQLLLTSNDTWVVTLNLSNEQLIGQWSLEITNSNETVVYERPLHIVLRIQPVIGVEVTTKMQSRAGRWQPFVITVSNRGNVNARGLPVLIQMPPSAKLKMDNSIFGVPQVIRDQMSAEDWENYSDEWRSWEDVPVPSELIDPETGEVKTTYSLLLEDLPPEGDYSVDLELQFSEQGEAEIEVTALPPIFDANCAKSEGCLSTIGYEVGKKLLGLVAPDVNAWRSCLENMGEFFRNSMELIVCSTGVERTEDKKIKTHSLKKMMIPALKTGLACGKAVGGTVPSPLKYIIKFDDCLVSAEEVRKACTENPDSTAAIPTLLESVLDLLFDVVGSSTPEDKFGIIGAESSTNLPPEQRKNFINQTEKFNYRIDYWNKPDATAPAVEVFIRDTIADNLDLTSLRFTEIGFLRWKVPVSGQYFNVNVDMRPDFDLIVNVEGTVDPLTREVYWVHRALDPETLELPYDPFAGFLPPVDTAWYNLGWVKYDIKPLPGLPSGTQFLNRAHVNFDGVGPWGKAPPYGPWVNTYDLDPPTSFVRPEILTCDTTLTLQLSGSDGDGAGIDRYYLYASVNGGDYQLLADTTTAVFSFPARPDSSYRFYSVAVDKVGNVEAKKPAYDPGAEITVTGGPADDLPPALHLQDLVVVLDSLSGIRRLQFEDFDNGTSVDNCGLNNSTISISRQDFSCRELGPNTVTVTATDPAGNTASRSVTVTVTDPYQACACENLPSTILIDDRPVRSGFYPAADTLISAGTVARDSFAVFQAGRSIRLEPGFRVQAGAVFTAFIADCETIPPIENQVVVNKMKGAAEMIPRHKAGLKVFPNPASDVVQVQYTLPEASSVRLVLLDQVGRLVMEPVSAAVQDTGMHQLSLPIKELPGNLYFLVLRTSFGTFSLKIILIR